MLFNQEIINEKQRYANNTNILFKTIEINKLITKKRLHVISVLCWLSMILVGTSLIGLSTSLMEFGFEHCEETQTFCTKSFQIQEQMELFFYIVLDGFSQNNRMFMDSYSALQLQGQIGNNLNCENYYTYDQLQKSHNAGGYRVPGSTNAHPCGEVMTNIFDDSIYLVNSDGGTPKLDSGDLVSEYNLKYKFIRLQNYQLSQWTDVQSTLFVNYFTIPYTSKKYMLLGRSILPADTYQLIIKNVYLTKGQFRKSVLVTQVNSLGTRDPLLGFYLFFWGIFVLIFHVFLCCYQTGHKTLSSHRQIRSRT